MVNGAGVDGVDGVREIGVGRDQNPDDAGRGLPGPFQQPDAFFAGHPLVGHEDADLARACSSSSFRPSWALVAV